MTTQSCNYFGIYGLWTWQRFSGSVIVSIVNICMSVCMFTCACIDEAMLGLFH